MKLLKCSQLSENQKKEAAFLTDQCQQSEQTSIGFPVDDSDLIYLLYDNQNLVSALSLFFPDAKSCECRAFTHPDHRRKGYFSRLLEEALDELETREENCGFQIPFYFITDGKSPSALHALDAVDARYWYSEYMMKLPLKTGSGLSPKNFTDSLTLKFYQNNRLIPSGADGLSGLSLSVHPVLCRVYIGGQKPVGCFLLSQINKNDLYLFGFEILRKLRGKGLGKQAMKEAINVLSKTPFNHLTLQVSEQNEAAFSLYKKTGFQITETLSYYLY